VHLDGRETHLTDRGDKRRVTRPERCRVEQRCIEGLVVCFVELVDDLAFDVRVKNLDFEAEFGGVTADSLIVFGQGHRAKDLGLDFAAHVHPRPMDHQNFCHAAFLSADLRNASGSLDSLTSVPTCE